MFNEIRINCVLEFLNYVKNENFNEAEILFSDDLRQNKIISRPELTGRIHYLKTKLEKNIINLENVKIEKEKLIFNHEFLFDVEFDYLFQPKINYFAIIHKD